LEFYYNGQNNIGIRDRIKKGECSQAKIVVRFLELRTRLAKQQFLPNVVIPPKNGRVEN